MNAPPQPIDIEALMDEIFDYLSAVELFRAEGCEPRWCVGSGAAPYRAQTRKGRKR